MSIELKIPHVGESISEVTIVEWLKPEGAWAKADETIAIIETDKADLDLVAPADGQITKVLKQAGEAAQVNEVVGYLEEGEVKASAAHVAPVAEAGPVEVKAPVTPTQAPAKPAAASPAAAAVSSGPSASPKPSIYRLPPSARRAIREGVAPAGLTARPGLESDPSTRPGGDGVTAREEQRVPMTRIRQKIAKRLVAAQTNAALLTTFNEADMSGVMGLRKRHQEAFVKRYGIKLGFMSFFIKAVIEALEAIPGLNAEIRGSDVIYRNYHDIGVAVGGGKGLVVPVIRNASRLSFAQIEQTISDFGQRAKAGTLRPDELQGGTFTISNGGVYGSLLSTPIINPPQSGILGMHAIQQRPVARDGQVVVRPMMNLALTYDHRIVDGREAVTFLVAVKDAIEEPTRIMLEV